MKILNSTKLAVLGLSAIAFAGVTQSAQAADIRAGIDYLFTPEGSDTWVDFDQDGPMGRTYFKGVPLLQGGADTAVERLDDCHFDTDGKCTVGLQFVSLNLMSVKPVPEFGDQFVFLMLDDDPNGDGIPDPQPIREMTIMDMGNNMASWTNILEFNWKLVDDLPTGNPIVDPSTGEPIKGTETFIGSGIGTYDDEGHFFVKTYDDQAAWARHTDKPIPEPSTTAGLIFLGLGSLLGIKRNSKQQ